jgi:hypothetical protein
MKFLIVLQILLLSFSTFSKPIDKDFKHWKITAGGFIIADYDAQISVKGNDGIFAGVELPDLLKMEPRTLSGFIDGYYRFNEKHKLEFGYKDIRSEGSINYTGSLFEGTPIEKTINGNISSHLETTAFKLVYSYSFYKTDEIEVAVSGGFHRTTVDLGLSIDGILDESISLDASQPLPVIGTRFIYTINPKWKILFLYDVFALGAGLELESNPGIKSFEGYLADVTLSTEYAITDFFSLGLSWNSVEYEFSLSNQSNYNVEIDNEVIGLVGYGAFYF